MQRAYTGGADQHLFDPEGNWLGNAGEYGLVRFGDRFLLVYTSSETDPSHVNSIGSTWMMTNHAGTPVEGMVFYPWGDVWLSSGTGGYNFAELPYRDTNTNTDFTTYRAHGPNFGRWMSPDPGGVKVVHLDDPQTWNMYAYVRNNPTTLTDPTGLYLLSSEESTNISSGEGMMYVNEWDAQSSDEKKDSAAPAQNRPQALTDKEHVIVPDPQSLSSGTYMGKALKEQQVFYETFNADDKGSPTSKDKKTDFELREKIVAGTKDVVTCGAPGSCVSGGGAFADQQRVFKGESYAVEKRFTIDGKSVPVYDPQTKKSYDYVVVHSTYERGFQFKFLNDPR